ncbi:hypothetical protein G7B40_039910 [Aetokthonos hydrillicola Thurmond2011]|uniref:Uncharacterized protein n=2 Tax=Aetokthonos TaxID=1550243 RepID=A0AAP5IHD8_9CYAN|nr:hypothetical protein [Aetokthonos hydrillicola]MBW4590112.1 hypothetical protein [Aetokthonos hydrillicola CCALA 1050]MDR9900657.1 hypothetical protein [Aetokthonos hydrillicola Thurmond2011]
MNSISPHVDFVALVTAVVEQLEGFSAQITDETPAQNMIWLTALHADGRKLCFRYSDGKIHIHGRYGQDAFGRSATPKNMGIVRHEDKGQDAIKVSANRTPEAIAKDIKRRLLPLYSEYFAKVREKVARQRERNTFCNQRLATLAACLGTADVKGADDYTKTAYFNIGVAAHGTLRTCNGQDYILEIWGISHDAMMAIAQVLCAEQAKATAAALAGKLTSSSFPPY